MSGTQIRYHRTREWPRARMPASAGRRYRAAVSRGGGEVQIAAPLLSIHDVKIFDGPAESSLRGASAAPRAVAIVARNGALLRASAQNPGDSGQLAPAHPRTKKPP